MSADKTQMTEITVCDEVIMVDPLTNNPTEAWERLRKHLKTEILDPNTYSEKPRQDNMLRFVCLSDTHGKVERESLEFHKGVPDGDVLIHCGDFTTNGHPTDIREFDKFLGRLPHPVKLVIAGNHEVTFDTAAQCINISSEDPYQYFNLPLNASWQHVVDKCKALLEHAVYLEDESISICGINIYASPWVPRFISADRGFSVQRGYDLLRKWNNIPSDTDILITHGPPCGYGDQLCMENLRAGCVELLNTVVRRVKPTFHVFGHIHTGHGMLTNGITTFINAAICDDYYTPAHNPIVFDYRIPDGYSRQDFNQISTTSLHKSRNLVFDCPNPTDMVDRILTESLLDLSINPRI